MFLFLPTLLSLLVPSAHAREPVTFLGFDYGLVRMIGTGDFQEPAEIFPGYLEKWNALWLEEKIEDTEKAIGPVTWAFDAVRPFNRAATADQIERRDGGPELVAESHVTDAMLAERLGRYELEAKSGLGLVVIVDRLVKTQAQGCSWVVYFDIASRDVRAKERVCEDARGFGFRNFWFNPLKELVDNLKQLKPKG